MTETEMTRSAWLKLHRGADLTIRMALGRPEVAAMTAAELAEAMVEEANAPPSFVAYVLRDVADFRAQRGDADTEEHARLREAARLIGAEPPPSARKRRTRESMQAMLPPPPSYTPLSEREIRNGLGMDP